MQYFGRDFFDEAGDDAELGLSVQHALLRHGDVEAFTGAGDGDVHEAAFFFEAAAFGEAHFAGEAAFFHAGKEDGVKFQAFGGVDGHELDGFFRLRLLGFRQTRGRRCLGKARMGKAGSSEMFSGRVSKLLSSGLNSMAALTSSSRLSRRSWLSPFGFGSVRSGRCL